MRSDKRLRRGSVLLPIEDAEDIVLAKADEYVRTRRQARAAHAKGRTTNLKDLT